MAAVHLHNAIHGTDSASHYLFPRPPHFRYSSAVSTDTDNFPASFDDRDSASLSYRYLLSRQPQHPDDPNSLWDPGLSLAADPPTAEELKWQADQMIRRSLLKFRSLRFAATIVLVAWTTYTIIRYFIAFYKYDLDPLRQHYIVAFGSASAFTFLALTSSLLVECFHPPPSFRLSRPRIHASCLLLSTILIWLGSVTLFCVTLANLVLTILWRRPTGSPANPEPFSSRRTLHGRCTWDIDVVWTGTGSRCTDGNGAIKWGYFLAGSIVRLVGTLVALAIFHGARWEYKRAARMPSTPMYARMTSPRSTMASTRYSQPASAPSQRQRRTSSGGSSVGRDNNRLSRGSETLANVPESFEQEPLPPKPPPALLTAGLQTEDQYQPVASTSTSQPSTPSPTSPTPAQPQAWADEFRSLVDQVEHETDEGMAYARHDKHNVRIVGGLVHRLSTIESVTGSDTRGVSRKGSVRTGETSSRKESWGSARSHLALENMEGSSGSGNGNGMSRKGSLGSSQSLEGGNGTGVSRKASSKSLESSSNMSRKGSLSRKESVPSLTPYPQEEGEGDGVSRTEEDSNASEVWMDARSEATISREVLR